MNQVFNYNGSPISFNTGEVTMVNATEMAKPFKKLAADWTRQKSAKEFIASLSAVRGIPITDLVKVLQGGNVQGTWMHEDVALEFARWLSPEFAIWCNDRIKELMRFGLTATPHTIESVLADPGNAIKVLTALQDERKRVKQLEDQKRCYQSENRRLLRIMDKQQNLIYQQEEEMTRQNHLVTYARNVLGSDTTFTTTQIAKELGMSAVALNRLLHEYGIQYNQSGHWFLYQQYADKGYVKTREHMYERKDGRIGLNLTMEWTTAGRMFIHEVMRFKRSLTQPGE